MSSLAATETATAFVEKHPLERYAEPAQPSLVGMPRAMLAQALAEVGVPEGQRRMRVQQIWHWLYVRGAQDFDAMTTLSKDLRAALALRFTLARPPIAAEQISVDGTRKWLIQLPGERVEAPHEARCAFPARSAARSIAASAIPVRSGWCAISPRPKSPLRSWSGAISLATGSPVRPPPARGGAKATNGSCPMS
jgi:hypothetical protein